jgi:hypothetical protein
MEYQLLMEVRDEAGKLRSRQTVDLGAVLQGQQRIFSLRVKCSLLPPEPDCTCRCAHLSDAVVRGNFFSAISSRL